MKLIVRVIGLTILFLIGCLSIWNVIQASSVRDSVERSLNRSIEQTVEEVKAKGMFTYQNQDEFAADFIKTFFESMTTKGDIEIKFYALDYTQGFIDVEVTKTFKYPTGQNSSITVRRAVITEEIPEAI